VEPMKVEAMKKAETECELSVDSSTISLTRFRPNYCD